MYRYQEKFCPEEIIVYLRKSRSDDPLLSIEEVLSKHEEILDEWSVKNLGATVPEKNKYREVVSGETLKDRPEIQTVLHEIESPKIKGVLVVEPQRLTRGDLEDIGRLMKLLKHTNTMVLTPQRIYDLHDDYDMDAFERELKRGNEYLEYTKKILNRGRLLSVSQGNFIGSIPPYGYDKTFIMEGRRKCPTLKINEDQAEVVRMIFDMYVNQDMGRTNICHQLDKMAITPPKGKHWSPAALKDLLENVSYIGKVKWNWRKTIPVVENGEIISTRPKSKVGEYLIYDGKHEAIISEELFQAAREKQGKHHRAKLSTKISNPFASLLYCHTCGRAMTLRKYRNPDGTFKSSARLICDDQVHCNTGSCLYSDMVDYVCNALQKSIHDFEILLKEQNNDTEQVHNNMIHKLEKRMKDLEAKELAQWEAQADPDPANRMPQHIFRQLNQKLQEEKEDVRRALQDAYESMPVKINYEEKIVKFQDAITALKSDNISPEQQNKLLKEIIERMEYSRNAIPRATRRSSDKSERLPGVKSNGWQTQPFHVSIRLKM